MADNYSYNSAANGDPQTTRPPPRRCHLSVEVVAHLTAIFLLILWLVGGMWAFYLIEHPAEMARIAASESNTAVPDANNETVVIDVAGLNTSETMRLLFEMLEANYAIAANITGSEIEMRPAAKNNQSNKADTSQSSVQIWDLTGSFFFCITVVTTIGYGNYSPTTALGKAVCVAFAAIGIPLALIVIGNLGKCLSRLPDLIVRVVECCCEKKRNQEGLGINSKSRCFPALLSTLVMSVFCIAVFLTLPARLFIEMEDWDYLTSLYYGFITLSSIGFGDYVAGQKSSIEYIKLYRLFLCVWIFFGMALIAMFISTVQSLIHNLTKKSASTLRSKMQLHNQKHSSTSSPEREEGQFTKNLPGANRIGEDLDIEDGRTRRDNGVGVTPVINDSVEPQ